jgi:GAF domain-containing protein
MRRTPDRARVEEHPRTFSPVPMTTRSKETAGAGNDGLQGMTLATSEEADASLDDSITAVLRLVREHLAMDVVFVAHYAGDLNVFTHADSGTAGVELVGVSQARTESFCQRVLDGRLPRVMPDVPELRQTHDVPEAPLPIGAYMATPVHLQDGSLYGTLCCFSFEPSPGLNERHYRRLKIAARLTARLIDEAAGRVAVVTVG